MTTDKPTPELKTFPQPKTIYRCDNCGKQGTPETCCNGWRMSEYTRSDFITRPSELRQAGVEELDGGTRNRVSMLLALGFKHHKDNGDHVVTGHGREYRHTSLLCLAQRIRDDFLAQPAAQKTEGAGDIAKAQVICDSLEAMQFGSDDHKHDAYAFLKRHGKYIYEHFNAALAPPVIEQPSGGDADDILLSHMNLLRKDHGLPPLDKTEHATLSGSLSAARSAIAALASRASVDVDYEQEGDDWIEVCEAYDQHQIERDHSPIETGSERLFLHTILDFLASQNRLIKPKKD